MSPQPAVNNFVAAKVLRPDSDGDGRWFSLSVSVVFRLGGPGLLTTSRFNDFELIDRPAGRT